ncbi:hypothetical protein AB395_00003414 [Sinorhizobium fredii CCBAU 45436]|nr:hypothetical protein AB395_00003414 [Sinorhizobium fredii CCBAU 45436]AWM26724.1 hypothetical protein AOX55_00003493 [Sinorhizobium fredii CCBAU 25509]
MSAYRFVRLMSDGGKTQPRVLHLNLQCGKYPAAQESPLEAARSSGRKIMRSFLNRR